MSITSEGNLLGMPGDRNKEVSRRCGSDSRVESNERARLPAMTVEGNVIKCDGEHDQAVELVVPDVSPQFVTPATS